MKKSELTTEPPADANNILVDGDDVEKLKIQLSKMADGATLAKIIKDALDMTLEDMRVANNANNCDNSACH